MTHQLRIISILHLCFAFSLLLFYASDPFLGHNFRIKSRALVYEHLMGTHNKDNAHRFSNLPAQAQEEVQLGYEKLQEQARIPFSERASSMGRLLLFDLPPMIRAWLFLSIFLPIAILRNKEGARECVWLLCILVCFTQKPTSSHTSLPSEKYLVDHYLNAPISGSISNQQKQLTEAWNQYLIVEWANETPSKDMAIYQSQVDAGDFAFQLDQLNNQNSIQESSILSSGISILWHIAFALVASLSIFYRMRLSPS